MKKWFFLLILMLVTPNVYAADSVVGTWRGSILIDELPVVVTIKVNMLALDEHSMTLNYGRPRKCQASAEYGGAVDQEHVFYFSGVNNAHTWCGAHLRPNSNKPPLIKLKLTESGKINYTLFVGKKRLEGGIVERMK